MRYGNPSIAEGLNNLRNQNCDRIIVSAFIPGSLRCYNCSTFDAVALELQQWRWGSLH